MRAQIARGTAAALAQQAAVEDASLGWDCVLNHAPVQWIAN
jgi:hypothetical protein